MSSVNGECPWVVITGASSGIGYATAYHFAQQGYSVALIARRAERLNALAQVLHTEFGTQFDSQFIIIPADLSTEQGIDHCIDRLKMLHISVLIHNAAMIQPISSLLEVTRTQWRQHMTLNVEAPFWITQALVKQLHGGRVILISSGAAHKSIAGWGTYCISKGTLYRLWENFKEELATQQITLASVRPGVVDTEMQAEIRQAVHPSFVQRPYFEMLKQQGQLINAEQVAHYLYRLCTDISAEELISKEWDIRDSF